LTLLFDILIALLLARALVNLVGTALSLAFFGGVRAAPAYARDRDWTPAVILPVLRESDRIAETIAFITTAASGSGLVECVVVGNAQERTPNGENPTLRAAQAAIGSNRFFRLLEVDLDGAIKAHQVNFAAADLHDRYPGLPLWIFLIDIDSRFPEGVLSEVADAVRSNEKIVQQHAIFLINFRSLPLIQKAHALYQSRWTISHEAVNNWLSYKTGWYVSHIVGHGAFLDLATFRQLGGFPTSTTTEDLHLGYYIVAAGMRIRSLRTLELAETPDSFSAALAQQKSWAFGPARYLRYRQLMKTELPEAYARNVLRSLVISIFGLMTFANWLLLFPGLLFVAIAAAGGSWPAILALALYYLELSIVCWFFVHRKWVPLLYALLGPLLMLLHMPVRSLAAWRAIWHLIRGKVVVRQKTINRAGG
jgi:cellulose synthase/poly-beta-1,6-N-acetylglucosamine synthase-like glycosyltransferase